jgi:hypothetical protein
MQLFNCTNSILDEEFQARFQSLAKIWRATTHQGERLPVLIEGLTPHHARILSGYLHQLAIEAYDRRANRIRSVG